MGEALVPWSTVGHWSCLPHTELPPGQRPFPRACCLILLSSCQHLDSPAALPRKTSGRAPGTPGRDREQGNHNRQSGGGMFRLKPRKSDDEREKLFLRRGKNLPNLSFSGLFGLPYFIFFLLFFLLFFSCFNLVCFQFQSLFRSFSPFSEYIYLY